MRSTFSGMERSRWSFDELAHAGREHLDADYAASYDRKAQGELLAEEDLKLLRDLGLNERSTLVDLGAGTGTVALTVARYCRRVVAVVAVLEQHPPDDSEDALRIALEAHLEGLAYAGTAAAEKTIRSVDPDHLRSDTSVENMIRTLRARKDSPEASFAGAFEKWWSGRNRGTRWAQTARDLRNDASHSFYEKGPGTGDWLMVIRDRNPIFLNVFTIEYLQELEELAALVADAEQVAGG